MTMPTTLGAANNTMPPLLKSYSEKVQGLKTEYRDPALDKLLEAARRAQREASAPLPTRNKETSTTPFIYKALLATAITAASLVFLRKNVDGFKNFNLIKDGKNLEFSDMPDVRDKIKYVIVKSADNVMELYGKAAKKAKEFSDWFFKKNEGPDVKPKPKSEGE